MFLKNGLNKGEIMQGFGAGEERIKPHKLKTEMSGRWGEGKFFAFSGGGGYVFLVGDTAGNHSKNE